MSNRKLITFDWALKRLLRSKANFEVLEGFLSELLGEDIQILEVLEIASTTGESNVPQDKIKFNRVDLKAQGANQEIILIEVQFDRELDFLQRILWGASLAITEHLDQGSAYSKVIKVISVNILYFNLGHGQDYIYHGKTTFTGIHLKDELELTKKQKDLFQKNTVSDIFPDYYLLKINQFDDHAQTTLDGWIYFLKNEEIKDDFTAKGLEKAKEILDVLKLSKEERLAYDAYLEDLHYQASMFESSYGDGMH